MPLADLPSGERPEHLRFRVPPADSRRLQRGGSARQRSARSAAPVPLMEQVLGARRMGASPSTRRPRPSRAAGRTLPAAAPPACCPSPYVAWHG